MCKTTKLTEPDYAVVSFPAFTSRALAPTSVESRIFAPSTPHIMMANTISDKWYVLQRWVLVITDAITSRFDLWPSTGAQVVHHCAK